jgi:hypothetical protein
MSKDPTSNRRAFFLYISLHITALCYYVFINIFYRAVREHSLYFLRNDKKISEFTQALEARSHRVQYSIF